MEACEEHSHRFHDHHSRLHYETQLLPIDEGRLLVVTHHGKYEVGGEDTRETEYARFAVSQLSALGESRDVTHLLTMPREASADEAGSQEHLARMQEQLAGAGQNLLAEHLAETAVALRHAAELAREPGVRVPRRVMTSGNGRAVAGFYAEMGMLFGQTVPGTLRVVDVRADRVVLEESSNRWPITPPRRGLPRLSAAQVGRPLAISFDGTRVLLPTDPASSDRPFECAAERGLPEVARLPAGRDYFLATKAGWIALEADALVMMGYGGNSVVRIPLPNAALHWAAANALDGDWIAVPHTHDGTVFLVSKRGEKPRRFHPHRGFKRGGFASVAMSSCGRWLASRAQDELVVTRLEDGVSWPVASLEDAEYKNPSHDDYTVESSVPAAFNFFGQRLLVVEGGDLRDVELGDPGPKAFVSEKGRPGARKPIRVAARATFARMMDAARLDPVADVIRPHYSPALRIKTKPLEKAGWRSPPDAKAPSLGASRLGGWPDMQPKARWPRWQTRPMAFLAQINLAEAHAVESRLRLPAEGLLSFFLGCADQTYDKHDDARPRYLVELMLGTEAEHRKGWRVIYTRDVEDIERRVYAKTPLPQLFEPCALRFTKGGMPLPDELAIAYERVPLESEQRDRFNELLAQLAPPEGPETEQLMGYPQLIQSTPPEMMCELFAGGRGPSRYPDAGSPEYGEIASAASEWGLLLQLTSNDKADFLWGDAGHLYFYGRRAAMERGDFSKTWVYVEA